MAIDRPKLLAELSRFQQPTALVFRSEDGTTAYVTNLTPWAERELEGMEDRHGSPIGFVSLEPCEGHIKESKFRSSPIVGCGELKDKQNGRILAGMAIEFELMLKGSGPYSQDEFCRLILEDFDHRSRPVAV